MAEAAAARREARRRRILENSHNRLQLISGKCGDECPRESPVRTITHEPVQEISNLADNISSCSKSSLNNGVVLPETELFDLITPSHDIATHDIASGDGQVPSDLAPFVSMIQEQTQTTPFWEKLTNFEYDIVLLSMLIQLMSSSSLVAFEGTYFFLPVLIYAITKLIWFPSQVNSKFSSILMLLQGISSHRVQKMIYIIQCVSAISRNICIFLFTTICIQSLFVTLKDGLVT